MNIETDSILKFLNYMKDGIIILDKEKNIEYVNEYAKKLLNIKNEQGKPFKEVINNDYLFSILSHNYDTENKEIIIKNEEIYINDAFYLMNYYFIDDKYYLIFTDITPFEVYKQAKKDFVSNVSHELKTPIAVLKGVIETIETEDDIENIHSFIKMAKKRVEQMNVLVDDLLIIAKLESKEEKITKEEINLYQMVESIFSDMKIIAEEKNVKLINNTQKQTKFYVDEKKFQILLKNLIENAIKYNRQNGEVELSSREDDKYSYLSVRDTGIGIPKESLPLIFERFYRVDKSRSRNIGGTGLGLSIVKHIAESHNGKIYVNSEIDKGSTFTVKIPKRKEEAVV